MNHTRTILETLLREVDAGRRVALCVIVSTQGSTPQPAGTMVCVDEAARLTGSLGGGCVEADVRRQAHHLLSTGRSEIITFTLDDDFGYDDGMICGGRMDVAVRVVSSSAELEVYREALRRLAAGEAAQLPIQVSRPDGPVEYRLHLEAPPQLLIAGAGHISRVLAPQMVSLGFEVHVIDDRQRYADKERFPPPIKPVVGDIEETLGRWPIDPRTHVVIVTRGHKHDEAALRAVLDSPAKYLGMIGSRRKIKVIFDDLRHEGVASSQLGRVHAPIGVDIGAVTAEEIALSIAAELVAHRRADHRRIVTGPVPLSREMP